MTMNKLVFSIEEAAKVLGIHRNSVYRAVARGEIMAVRVGSRVLIPRAEFERLGLLAKQTPAGAGGEG